jgi:hypothetical protein
MLSVLFISLSKSVFKHSLSQKVSLLSKNYYYSLTLLWSYNNGTTGKRALSLTKKTYMAGAEIVAKSFTRYFFFTSYLTQFRQIKIYLDTTLDS